MKEKKTTEMLEEILLNAKTGDIEVVFAENADRFAASDRPFAAYMRARFKEKGIRQQDIFLKADISEGYGYKIISEEKRTRQRDTILRICLAAGFTLDETQRALKLYGMPALYARIPRDAVLIIAINTGIRDVTAVDELLENHGCEVLTVCGPLN